MRKIALLSCVKTKCPHRAKAKDLYSSTLFRLSFEYALSLAPDEIFILSAQYHLVHCEYELEPYELTLNTMKSRQVREWADVVLSQLNNVSDLENDKFIFLASETYRKYLLPGIKNYEIPLKGLTIGRQLAWLKKKLMR